MSEATDNAKECLEMGLFNHGARGVIRDLLAETERLELEGSSFRIQAHDRGNSFMRVNSELEECQGENNAKLAKINELQGELDIYKKAGHIQIWREQKAQLLILAEAVIKAHDKFMFSYCACHMGPNPSCQLALRIKAAAK